MLLAMWAANLPSYHHKAVNEFARRQKQMLDLIKNKTTADKTSPNKEKMRSGRGLRGEAADVGEAGGGQGSDSGRYELGEEGEKGKTK